MTRHLLAEKSRENAELQKEVEQLRRGKVVLKDCVARGWKAAGEVVGVGASQQQQQQGLGAAAGLGARGGAWGVAQGWWF